jgi:adenosylmethionine-8-amino-7-oxononanoate aminotransferase
MTHPDELLALDRRHVWHPFTQAKTAPDSVLIRSGKGAVVYGADGKEYLDLISSWWVNLHGHAHPYIADAIAEQAHKLEQVIFAGLTHEPAVRLAQRLTSLLPDDLNRVFYSDDGSTAVEVALKLALQYWRNLGRPERRRYLAFEGGYHGDTVGAMSVGVSSGFYAPFEDLLFEVDVLPFPETWEGDAAVAEKEDRCLSALEAYLDRRGDETAAAIIEPLVQGVGGMRMCRAEFLQALVQKLRAAGVLVIFDEVMTGFGRTGDLFACLKAGVTPDLICLSKGLTAGFLPLAATVCRDPIYEAFLDTGFDKAFAHGHSFTANPLGCAAGLASLDLLMKEETRARIAAIEARHRKHMARLAHHPKVTRPRVTGTIAALNVEVEDSGYAAAIGPRLKAFFLENGLLLRPLGEVIYFLPPYCISDSQLDRSYDTLERALTTLTPHM